MTRTREENARDLQYEEGCRDTFKAKGGPYFCQSCSDSFEPLPDMQKRLIEFAEHTLARLENDEDWGCETFDSIAAKALDLDLADFDTDTMFKRKRPGS